MVYNYNYNGGSDLKIDDIKFMLYSYSNQNTLGMQLSQYTSVHNAPINCMPHPAQLGGGGDRVGN